ncbi:hypothetical protein L3Q82_004880 [Scortum barcoo]|uniref:Uncharacterized protein n=1 Tax=Scortum barcoo TaxID=214431 RepID=A0ACB8VDM3_9TELE|nr:hypothetical protein L3Q82_004880 [Scortum barcoo]
MEDGVSRRWVAFGLVSWGGPEDCGSQRVYGVYTRVAKYVEWIQNQLQAAPWWSLKFTTDIHVGEVNLHSASKLNSHHSFIKTPE